MDPDICASGEGNEKFILLKERNLVAVISKWIFAFAEGKGEVTHWKQKIIC